ncbi:hypothetical protein ACWGLL_12055 [Brevundimonas sp. NPDC055814]
MHIKTWLIAAAAGAAGALLTLASQNVRLAVIPIGMSFSEWAGLLLTSVAILVTALGVLIAIAAVWGFSGIKAGAEDAAVEHVTQQLENGGVLAPQLRKSFENFLERQLRDDRLRRYMEERVNVVIYRGAESRAEAADDDNDAEYVDPDDQGETTDNDAAR